MNRRQALRFLSLVALFLTLSLRASADNTPADEFRLAARAKAETLAKAEQYGFRGEEGFYFLAGELKHYGAGPFWGESAPKVSAASANQDPLPVILDFYAQLKKAGVHLILVPVPGKASIYPDKFDRKLQPGKRLDVSQQTFFELLRKEGIDVIDLMPKMLDMRKAGADTHCKQDSHWSPAAVKMAAQEIGRSIQRQHWYANPKPKVERTSKTIEFHGDLVTLLKDEREPKEKQTIEQVTLDGKPVTDDRKSPIVLMGDSHTVVYHEPINGGIPANDAGLMDLLAVEIGIAPDMIGVLGSGANASRITLARRKDNLTGKKCVIWCFAVRELTESSAGWLKIPVVR